MAATDPARIRFSWPGALLDYEGTEAGAVAAVDFFWRMHEIAYPKPEFALPPPLRAHVEEDQWRSRFGTPASRRRKGTATSLPLEPK